MRSNILYFAGEFFYALDIPLIKIHFFSSYGIWKYHRKVTLTKNQVTHYFIGNKLYQGSWPSYIFFIFILSVSSLEFSKGGELHLINVLERLLDVHDSKIKLQLLWFTLLYDTKLVIVDKSSQREVLRLRVELVDNSVENLSFGLL